MQNEPNNNFVDSFDAEDVQRPSRRLRKVDTDELDFEALCDDLDEWSCKKTNEDNGFRMEALKSVCKTTMMASMLIEALSADPVSPALKSGVKKKPRIPMFNNQKGRGGGAKGDNGGGR